MRMFKVTAATLFIAALASPVAAHETGVAHAIGALHPIIGVDHLLILLAVVAVGAILAWRSR
ncbi:MAG: HupE/UreJ family protein [Alphaproteobacteria bacterium]|jgi:hydrogenase/urease accessory protein HupE|nr:HupE/UreJ family protein [Alphaproteobacteria bacterium]